MNLDIFLPICSVLIIYLVRVRELRTRRDTIAGTVRETLTLRLFVATGTLMLAGSIVEFLWIRKVIQWETAILGWICALASFGLRRGAIAALGRFWSLHIEIRERHLLVQDGPFRWVRHPTYLSMILELLACGLILNAFYSLGITAILFIPILWFRVRLEEAALIEKFGDLYREYRRGTPALVPYKIPRNK